MVQLNLKPDIETRVRERLSAGVDANDLMEVALLALSEREDFREEIDAGWAQADAGAFVQTSPESVIIRADESR